MNALTLVSLLLLSGTADDLVPARIEGMKLRVPAAWTHRVSEGTYHYTAPSEDGGFEVSAYTLAPRHARLCLDQLLEALGGEKGWTRTTVAGQPAAKRMAVDDSETKKGEYSTYTFLGCNGRIKWVLTFSMHQRKKERFAPLADKIVSSIEYPLPE